MHIYIYINIYIYIYIYMYIKTKEDCKQRERTFISAPAQCLHMAHFQLGSFLIWLVSGLNSHCTPS